jgi:hypothetical protein
MKLIWLGYLVYSFVNCAMKLCIETDLMCFFTNHELKTHPTDWWDAIAEVHLSSMSAHAA